MKAPKIAAIVLVRNEDLYIETVLRNILDFCDAIHVADHQSTDGTGAILRRLAADHAKIDYRVVGRPAESHDLIAGYAGSPTWVFGVDGDEVYDPAGLRALRPRLLAGEHGDVFKLLGNVLNVRELDRERHVARGHRAPPCRSMVKLFNFGAIDAWPPPCPERLHGGVIAYKPGFGPESVREWHQQVGWDESPLRCLHLCFTHRSSADLARGGPVRVRKGVGESMMWSYNLRARLLALFGRPDLPYYKKDFYRRGPIVETDARPFGL